MTRFVGESLQTRQGRHSKALLSSDRQKAMKVFQETGKHPLIESTREENARSVLTQLPTLDINRPHIFMDFHQQGRSMGRIIVELFEDIFPVLGAAFRHRCLEVRHLPAPSFELFRHISQVRQHAHGSGSGHSGRVKLLLPSSAWIAACLTISAGTL
jgi:hypothetical protein